MATIIGNCGNMKIHLAKLDDGSVLIEWLDVNKRFGFNIEPNKKDSGWFFVARGGISEGDYLPDWFVEAIDLEKLRNAMP